MPRIRSLKPDIWQDEVFGRVSFGAQLLFTAIITQPDDAGRLEAGAGRLRATIWPYKPELSEVEVEAWLRELDDARLIVRYVADGRKLIAVRSWDKHQRVSHARPSLLPAPPGLVAAAAPALAVSTAQLPLVAPTASPIPEPSGGLRTDVEVEEEEEDPPVAPPGGGAGETEVLRSELPSSSQSVARVDEAGANGLSGLTQEDGVSHRSSRPNPRRRRRRRDQAAVTARPAAVPCPLSALAAAEIAALERHWVVARRPVRDRVNDATWQLWLERLHVHEHDEALVLGAPPELASWVVSRYSQVLRHAAPGRAVTVVPCQALAASA